MRHDTVKGVAQLQPLFEFSGACSGCGETPYLKTLTQLFGDRLVVANATGCSSIYGGNLPTTPYATNAAGRGPAWCQLAVRGQRRVRPRAAAGLGDATTPRPAGTSGNCATLVGADLADALLAADQTNEAGIAAQRERVDAAQAVLAGLGRRRPRGGRHLRSLADELVDKSVWIIGGDGWAYDIGYGGLDHVLGSGRNVNILVLDTEVYSNTGGQASKATPRGAVAKFAASGKAGAKKDLGAIAQAYGNVYVAQIAIGANEQQTVRALLEAQAWPGTVADHRLQHLHRARHRDVDVDEPPEGRRGQRLLAAVPVPARATEDAQPPVPAGLQEADRPGQRLHAAETRFSMLAPDRSRAGRAPGGRSPRPTPTSAGATTRSWPDWSARCRTRRLRRTTRQSATRPRSPRGQRAGARHDRSHPTYLGLPLTGPVVASASPTDRQDRHPASSWRPPEPQRSCCPRCSRRSSSTRSCPCTRPWSRAPTRFAESLDYFPHDRLLRSSARTGTCAWSRRPSGRCRSR